MIGNITPHIALKASSGFGPGFDPLSYPKAKLKADIAIAETIKETLDIRDPIELNEASLEILYFILSISINSALIISGDNISPPTKGPINIITIHPCHQFIGKTRKNKAIGRAVKQIFHTILNPCFSIYLIQKGIDKTRDPNKTAIKAASVAEFVCKTYLQYIGYIETISPRIAWKKDWAKL